MTIHQVSLIELALTNAMLQRARRQLPALKLLVPHCLRILHLSLTLKQLKMYEIEASIEENPGPALAEIDTRFFNLARAAI